MKLIVDLCEQILRCLEADDLLGIDVDGIACSGVPTNTRYALLGLTCTKAPELNSAAMADCFGDFAEDHVNHSHDIRLREVRLSSGDFLNQL